MVMQEGWASEPKRRTTRRDSSESWGMLVDMRDFGGGTYDGLVDVPGGGQMGEEDGTHWVCWERVEGVYERGDQYVCKCCRKGKCEWKEVRE
jgi:hypothetical protein